MDIVPTDRSEQQALKGTGPGLGSGAVAGGGSKRASGLATAGQSSVDGAAQSYPRECPRCYAPAGGPCFDMRYGWDAWTAKGIAKLRGGWRPPWARDKASPHRVRIA
jgi:hypothetical protein